MRWFYLVLLFVLLWGWCWFCGIMFYEWCLYPACIWRPVIVIIFVLMYHWNIFIINQNWVVHFIRSDHSYIFYGPNGLWKWRKNSTQNANTFYYLSVLESTNELHNWQSIVQNVWTTKKCTKKTENVNMAGSNKFVANAKEVKFVITTNEDQPVMPVVENGFARKICND